MRLRNITGARDVIAESEYVVQEPTEYKGRWKDLFENKGELRVEVGMGKGKFMMGHSFVDYESQIVFFLCHIAF